jgi:hypothetical protein
MAWPRLFILHIITDAERRKKEESRACLGLSASSGSSRHLRNNRRRRKPSLVEAWTALDGPQQTAAVVEDVRDLVCTSLWYPSPERLGGGIASH